MDQDISAALGAAARMLGRSETVAEKLTVVVENLARSLPGFEHVGVSTIDRHGHIETQAATSQLVWDLDALQYRLGEGPCVDSMHDATIVEAPTIRHDQRWPRYVPAAVELGLKSQLAVKLYVDQDKTIGGLNIYSTLSEDLDPQAVWIADIFAAQAAGALGQARALDDLRHAMETRQLIGQAVGLVMARYSLDAEAAFNFLARTSSHANIKLRDIARRVIDDHAASLVSPARNDSPELNRHDVNGGSRTHGLSG